MSEFARRALQKNKWRKIYAERDAKKAAAAKPEQNPNLSPMFEQQSFDFGNLGSKPNESKPLNKGTWDH